MVGRDRLSYLWLRVSDQHPILLFDGECNLCHGVVQFVIKRDPRARIRFCALQSAVAARLLAELGKPLPAAAAGYDTVLWIDPRRGRVFEQSGAALRVALRLSFPWPLLAGCLLVPAPLRDLVYRWVAKRRFRWGRRELCLVPSAGVRERFLSD